MLPGTLVHRARKDANGGMTKDAAIAVDERTPRARNLALRPGVARELLTGFDDRVHRGHLPRRSEAHQAAVRVHREVCGRVRVAVGELVLLLNPSPPLAPLGEPSAPALTDISTAASCASKDASTSQSSDRAR